LPAQQEANIKISQEQKLILNTADVVLHVSGAMFIPAHCALIISDLHAGKATHFSKAGIPISHLVEKNNYWKLSGVMDLYSPREIIFLGDLFHSALNDEWKSFIDFLDNYPQVQRTLILGNHDILKREIYSNALFQMMKCKNLGDLLLTHEPVEDISKEFINVCGHIHPAYRLSSRVMRSVVMPCFYVMKHRVVMPAFGSFTGSHIIHPAAGDQVYAIANNRLVAISC